MSTFPLRIGTPDGLLFEGDVERVVCRSVGGEISESGIEENKGYRHFKTVWQSNL